MREIESKGCRHDQTDGAGAKRMETVPAKRQPNIQDLLRHTPGFTYGRSGTTEAHKSWPVSSSFSSLTYTGLLSRTPLLDQPGTVWDYGVSVYVLGLVIEANTGKSLGQVMQERLWQPLGMVDTSFNIPSAKRSRYALAFRNDPFTENPQSALHQRADEI
jgi:CubicO group peptidase (beta-lactamase class C family)